MKRITLSFVILLCFVFLAATWSKWNGVTVGSTTGNVGKYNNVTIGTTTGNMGAWNALTSPSGATTTYFGGVSNSSTGAPLGSSTDTLSGFVIGSDATNTTYAKCPGSGTKTIVEMGAYVSYSGGSGNQVRIAIYNAGTGTGGGTNATFVAQTALVNVPGTSLGWAEATSGFLNQSLSPITPTITGGNLYLLVITETSVGGTISFGYGTVASSNNMYLSGNYSSGFPATITLGSNDGTEFPDIRIGVQ